MSKCIEICHFALLRILNGNSFVFWLAKIKASKQARILRTFTDTPHTLANATAKEGMHILLRESGCVSFPFFTLMTDPNVVMLQARRTSWGSPRTSTSPPTRWGASATTPWPSTSLTTRSWRPRSDRRPSRRPWWVWVTLAFRFLQWAGEFHFPLHALTACLISEYVRLEKWMLGKCSFQRK